MVVSLIRILIPRNRTACCVCFAAWSWPLQHGHCAGLRAEGDIAAARSAGYNRRWWLPPCCPLA